MTLALFSVWIYKQNEINMDDIDKSKMGHKITTDLESLPTRFVKQLLAIKIDIIVNTVV